MRKAEAKLQPKAWAHAPSCCYRADAVVVRRFHRTSAYIYGGLPVYLRDSRRLF